MSERNEPGRAGEREGDATPGDDARLVADGAADEFLVRALERAQRVARNHGYTRSTLPSWGLDETRPRGSPDGSS